MTTTLKDNLRRLMRQQRLNLQDVENATGVSIATVSRICSGLQKNPNISTLEKIAVGLGVTLADLMGQTYINTVALSAEDSAVLALYRQLNEEDKARVRDFAEALLMTQKPKPGRPRNM